MMTGSDVTLLSPTCHLFSRMSDSARIRATVAMYMINVHRLDSDALSLRTGLHLAGASGVLSSNAACVLRAVKPWTKPHGTGAGFTLDIFVNPALRRSSAQPSFRGVDHLVFASFGNDLFGFDLRRRRITAVVGQHTAQDERFWNLVLLPIAIGVMGTVLGVVPMHCACLEWRSQGVLITGSSGAGKSTLCAAMAQYGFTYISDDWTYVSDAGGSLVAHGLNIPLKLLPDARKFFSLRDGSLAIAMNGEWAYEVDPSEIAAKTKTSTKPKRLLLLQRSDRRAPKFERLASDAIREFFERSSERLPECLPDARRNRSRIIDRVANLDCWRFTYSGSPHEAANAIRYFLEK